MFRFQGSTVKEGKEMLFVYLILLVISVVFYIMYLGTFSFYLMIFMVSMPIVLFALSFYISKRLNVSFRQKMLKCPASSVIHPELIIENPTIFPISNLEITLEFNSAVETGKNITKINTPVLPMETQNLRMNIASLHIGIIDFRIKKCRIFDILRLFHFKLRSKGFKQGQRDMSVIVFPKYIQLDNAVSDYSNFGIETDEYSPDKKGDDPSQIFDIHEYIEGDKLNRIHWKLTAKQDKVMVKDYSLMMTYAVRIFINLNISRLLDYDIIVESALSVSMLLVEKGIAHTIEWLDPKTKKLKTYNIKNEQEHQECAERLINAKTFIDESTEITHFTDESDIPVCGHLIVVSKPMSEKSISYIVESGFASKYTIALAQDDTDTSEHSDPRISDNSNIIYIQKDRITEAFSDIII